jgi:Uma2 family endonuclease
LETEFKYRDTQGRPIASAPPIRHYTVSEYLDYEILTEWRNEFLKGHVRRMPDSTVNHSHLKTSLTCCIGNRINGRKDVEPWMNLRINVPDEDFYTYPDLCVSPSPAEFTYYRDTATLLNPFLVIEVLCATHEAYDRGEKFTRYRQLPSLQEYVLVESEDARVDRFTRHANGSWLLHSVSGMDASVTFETLDFSVPLSELYDDIELDPPCWEKVHESYY